MSYTIISSPSSLGFVPPIAAAAYTGLIGLFAGLTTKSLEDEYPTDEEAEIAALNNPPPPSGTSPMPAPVKTTPKASSGGNASAPPPVLAPPAPVQDNGPSTGTLLLVGAGLLAGLGAIAYAAKRRR